MEAIKRWGDSAFLGWAVSSYHVRVGNPSHSTPFGCFECGACVRRPPDAVWGKSSLESMRPAYVDAPQIETRPGRLDREICGGDRQRHPCFTGLCPAEQGRRPRYEGTGVTVKVSLPATA